MYCERDYVVKASDVGGLLAECDCVGLVFSAEKEAALRAALEDARRQREPRSLPFLNLLAGWDEKREKYYLAVRDMYDPRNLLEVLYDRLVVEKTGNPEKENEKAGSLIGAYLGVIEEKEHISLAETREKLTRLTADMHRTLAVYEDEEYSPEELERLYDTLTKAYFDPVRELLEGVIVAIAGN
ncbi:MAG: hypothetical protein FWG35_00025 [Spirochaetaceae bacterium]|nr:hypothetical protein [Spirochaetaceae bacterium]